MAIYQCNPRSLSLHQQYHGQGVCKKVSCKKYISKPKLRPIIDDCFIFLLLLNLFVICSRIYISSSHRIQNVISVASLGNIIIIMCLCSGSEILKSTQDKINQIMIGPHAYSLILRQRWHQ